MTFSNIAPLPAGKPAASKAGRPNLTAVPKPAFTAAARTARPEAKEAAAPEARGFALYVGLDSDASELDGISLTDLVTALRTVIAERAPHAQSYASVAFAPADARGENIDLVRLALQEPGAVRDRRQARQEEERAEEAKRASAKVTIDTSRKRVEVRGENAEFTYKEFELLQALVLREGRTVSREEIIDVLWRDTTEERPHERTIDVHVRRLRQRLGEYADIVRTVRGAGYRFDRHADVRVVHAPSPSPDRV
ncbi:winged helix-turn-helix domain-containing protein [Gulosibacter chungangensis]|uniref:Winged helix-turn-helix transcriptional regulator n=1 Tax=Gulosibacter chungangensis TaxID=979746 RepID=A0A7J5BFD9_9MICO|nr:winged helix-turn-helix domain-containing protein [Gulosibacter chungangensis]KAB1644987.1 winged helix-turn-helix transcriptional regulator [Gulosibacter chungangensis]